MIASRVLVAVLALLCPALAAGGAPAAGTGAMVSPRAPVATPQFRSYGIAEGLPAGTVYAVAQDRRGFMWFGSIGGLTRYDGIGFHVFRHVDGDPTSLPANQIYALFVDRDNRVWAGGVSSGLMVYDQQRARFSHWQHDPAQPSSLASNEVWGIAQTPDGRLWVATENGLDRMLADGRGFEHMPLAVAGEHAPSFGSTRALLAEPDGRLWVGTGHGLYRRDPDGSWHSVAVDPAFRGDIGMVWRIEGGKDEVRVAVTGGLLIIGADGVAHPLASKQLASRRVVSSSRDAMGRLWIGTANGVLFEQDNGLLQLMVGEPLLPGGLPGHKTWQTLIDREGGLWITFDQSAVSYLPPGWSGFSRFTHVPDDPGSLTGIAATAIALSHDGKLWVGGDNGWIDKLDVTTGEVEHVVRNMAGQVVSMAEDARGRLWIDTPPQIHLLDHGKLVPIDLGSAGMTRPVVLEPGPRGTMYAASWGEGVFAIDTTSLAVTPVSLEQSRPETLRPEQISFHDGRLWYASDGGLMRWDEAAGKLVFVPGVPWQRILVFGFDASGFWLASSAAMDHYTYVDGRATRDDSVAFPAETFTSDISDLRVDQRGQPWVFSNPGLRRFDRSTRTFKAFGASQGLSNANFSAGGADESPDGTLFAASNGGVMAFHPELSARARKPGPLPLVTITGISVRRGGRTQALPRDRPVQLGWRDRDLKVEVRSASYVDPGANRYYFHLRGFNAGWVGGDNTGERNFAGLGAGSYILEVRAAGADGQWGQATPLSIHVQAPPWARWWAWLLYALLLIAVVGGALLAWRRRLAQRHHVALVEQQRHMAENASAAKSQFLATLSHEIRTPMTGVMGMAELLMTTPLSPLQHDYTQAMQRSGNMLLKLLNDSLDLARIEAGKLELERVPFDPRQLLRDVSQLEQGLAFTKGIRFALEIHDDLPEQVLGDPVRIKQVLFNLANNALKFTEHGSVTLRAQRSAPGLIFSISDTGPGIPEASQMRLFQRFEQQDGPQRRAGSGLGLAICRELVEMMGGSIELESRLGHGSTFKVKLPLGCADVASDPAVAHAAPAGGYRLLLVEDDAIVAAVIGGLLAGQGHAVAHVANGLTALTELAHTEFDAILLDLDLPGVDGFQVARLIRQREPADARLPIVAVTARTGSNDESRAREAGMDGFLHKPVTGEQLATALAQVVRPRQTSSTAGV